MKKIGIETWASIAAVVVALAAVFLSIFEGMQNRKHQRLSVRPYLEIGFHFTDEYAGWDLSNNGIGPARVSHFALFVDGKEYKDWHSLLKKHNLADKLTYTWPAKNDLIKAGDRWPLFRFPRKSPSATKLKKELRRRMLLKISYCSFYDECWSHSTDRHEHTPTRCE